jgi:NADPH:quinone reductase-like Zn-dependent oxidoreductase
LDAWQEPDVIVLARLVAVIEKFADNWVGAVPPRSDPRWLRHGENLELGSKLEGEFGTAVCSSANVEMVKSLGADKVIDYTKEDFTKNGRTYDLIFDIVGATTFSRCENSLKPRGVFLQNIIGLTDLVRILWTSVTGRKKLKGGVAMENLGRMNFIVQLAATGKLKAVIDKSYPLEQVAEAFKYVEQGHKKGNVVITVGRS